MITTMTTQAQNGANGSMGILENTDVDVDSPDNGSSSLSEIDVEDPSDDDHEAIALQLSRSRRNEDMEVDSEAETEKLEKTPLKPHIIVDAATQDKTPSKLSTVMTREALEDTPGDLESLLDAELPDSPSPVDHEARASQSPTPVDGKINLGKRKRPSPGASSMSDLPLDEPLPKRTHTLADDLQLKLLEAENRASESLPEVDAEDQPVDTTGSTQDAQDDEVESHLNEAAEEELRPAPRGKSAARGKGRRKGRKDAVLQDADTPAEISDTPIREAEEPVEEDREEEDDPSHDEEVLKRKIALEALTNVEKDFIGFRDRLLQEQIDQVDVELSLLQQPNSTHVAYLAQLACVDERRDEKIRHENALLKYNLQALVNKTIAERGQLLSQYFQDVREIRDNAIDRCYKEVYTLQKERRRYGMEESSTRLYSNRKPELMQEQQARNMEVSVLAGIAKHVGFPAAPEMSALSAHEIQRDLEAMEITRQPSSGLIRPQPIQDRTPASEQFIERTPWANPQHPAHAAGSVKAFHSQGTTSGFATPAQQRRVGEPTTVNGSASTIEMASNPPSSAAHTMHHYADVPVETPVPVNRIVNLGIKDMERIQTTHNSSQPGPSMTPFGQGSPPHQAQSDFGSNRQVLQARRGSTSTPRAMGEGLGQAPARTAIVAGSSVGRFSS
ncbi:hypothetical protein BT63DRAFT_24632 [Microthyrium microscopicum]|uniref:Transcriptional regulatory protein DEP1 n=1 Tax=Microthyrium microscopicum TaxID=703497 RepID=A0A6A6UT18_9PEZI|nr:hypothetical protein BT63DRAFT_24632 [Microthyrium microscopicum]